MEQSLSDVRLPSNQRLDVKLVLIPSTTGFKLLPGKLQSCLFNPSSCVSTHSVSAAEMRI